MMTLLISSMQLNNPTPRTTNACDDFSITSPPTFTLLLVTASYTSSAVRSYWARRLGLTLTSYVFTGPPKATTSATPGTVRRLRSITQSCIVRNSAGVFTGECKVYLNICLLYTSDAADERSSVD